MNVDKDFNQRNDREIHVHMFMNKIELVLYQFNDICPKYLETSAPQSHIC